MVEAQKAEVEKVLTELEVATKPTIEVFNKIDLLTPPELDSLRRESGGHAAFASGLTSEGVKALLDRIDNALVTDPIRHAKLRIPQSEGAVLAAIEAGAVIESTRFEGNLTHLVVRAPASLVGRFRRFLET